MSIIGNILWIILGGGIVIFFEYLVMGLALCLTVIGIPFGLQCFKLALLGLVPFGKEIIGGRSASGVLATIMNILWILTGGVVIALTHAGLAVLLALTIIGLPFARQHIKLASLALTPFDHQIR